MKHENPKTVAEHLDNAEDGAQFGCVLQNLFRVLEQAMDDE